MAPPRKSAGLAALATVILILSSLGMINALSGNADSSAASSAPLAAAGSAASSTAPHSASDSTPAALGAGAGARAASLTASTSVTPTGNLAAPPAPLDQTNAVGADADSALGAQILHALSAKGIPLHDIELPYFLNGPDPALTNGHVHLTYTSSPAPYGIGDFGLENDSGVITPTTLSTPSVEANFSTDHLSGYSADLSSPDEWGIQLNAVLNNVTLFGTTGYQFWTQNVLEYSPSLNALELVSNIWNFSNPTAYLSCNFLYSSDGNVVCPEYYYGVTSYIPATYPFSVQLYLNSSLVGGRDAVYFNYSLTSGLGTTGGNFNFAIFNSLATGGNPALTPKPEYVANGFAYNPLGLPDDFEITLGGPGGGSNFDLFESDQTYLSLQYYNVTDSEYLTVPAAFNVGGETGETSVGVNAAWSVFHGVATTPPGPASCVACVTISNGPSFQYGLWNVLGAGVGGYSPPAEASWLSQSDVGVIVTPMSAFVFMAEGTPFTTWTGTNWSLFQWDPDLDPEHYYTNLPIGEYTIVVVASEHEAAETTEDIANNAHYVYPTMAPSTDTTGVYTPLWAFNATALATISSGVDADGNHILYDNEYSQIGQIPVTSGFGMAGNAAYFPWFGAFNDYGFPVFPGILLNDTEDVDVFSAPSFTVTAPPGASYQRDLQHFGGSETNNLQMLFWYDEDINFESSTVGGWFPAVSDFGPSQSFASVVFWNTSDSNIAYNTFDVGGMGLFLYGGYYNYLYNNVFVQAAAPIETNPAATAAAEFGSIGLVDADWGDASLYGADAVETCDVCDGVYNNAFDTIVTATELTADPYTGEAPALYPYGFSEAWNVPFTPGVTNIIGGNYLGGNYYWDYGSADNPYGVLPDPEINYLPYDEFGAFPAFICASISYGLCDYGGGDYYPLVNVPLYNIRFKEVGLPAGIEWWVAMEIPREYNFQSVEYINYTDAPGTNNFTETAGTYSYEAWTPDPYYSATVIFSSVTVDGATGNVTVTVVFEKAYVLTIKETGLPAGTVWYGYVLSDARDAYIESATSTGDETNVTWLTPDTYLWWAFSLSAEFAAIPVGASVTVAGNMTVDVAFVAEYFLDVHAVGLPAGTPWTISLSSTPGYDYYWFSTEAWVNSSEPYPGVTYAWVAASAGYVATPSAANLTLSMNTTLTITFAPVATLTFTETELPPGTSWSVTVTQGTSATTLSGTGNSIVFNAMVGAYTYTVGSNGYAATPDAGSGTLPADTTVAVVFASATGTLAGTVTPSGATLWVDGAKETVGSGGTYSLTLPAGVHSIEVTDSGYVSYFNNATVSVGTTTTVNIALTSSSTTASGISGIDSDGWLLIALLAALAAIFLLTTLIFAGRGRQPPPVAAYNPPPAAATGTTPAAEPEWQETPPSPPGTS